jgi:hypothetical protein
MSYKTKNIKNIGRAAHNRPLFLAFGILLIAAGLVLALELTNTTHLFHSPKTAHIGTVPNINTGSGKLPTDSPSGKSPNTNNTPSTNNSKATVDAVAPSGSFVSNHRPNLSGSPSPNLEESVCITTPGAQCQIVFTKDGITKKLPIQTVGSNSTTIWGWTLSQIGLTAGKWQVIANASSDSQSKSTIDSLPLEVSP